MLTDNEAFVAMRRFLTAFGCEVGAAPKVTSLTS